MRTSWFTFGYDHCHEIAGQTFDGKTMVEITALDPRAVMFGLFGRLWSFEYEAESAAKYMAEWTPKVVRLAFVSVMPDECVDAEGNFYPRGRCDTCGQPCDNETGECTANASHEVAIG